MFSLRDFWDYYGRFPVGFPLHVCSFATKETGGWNWKGLPYRIFRQHCWMRTRVLAGCSHLPLRGQMTTVATKQRANFGEITPGSLRSRPTQRCCLAAQHPVLKTLLANHGFPASVLRKQLYPLSTGLLTTNLQSPLKSFPGWRASALTTLLDAFWERLIICSIFPKRLVKGISTRIHCFGSVVGYVLRVFGNFLNLWKHIQAKGGIKGYHLEVSRLLSRPILSCPQISNQYGTNMRIFWYMKRLNLVWYIGLRVTYSTHGTNSTHGKIDWPAKDYL